MDELLLFNSISNDNTRQITQMTSMNAYDDTYDDNKYKNDKIINSFNKSKFKSYKTFYSPFHSYDDE